MRKSIFKDEIHYYFERYALGDDIRHGILNALFDNPISSSKQYLLKDSIDVSKLDQQIKPVIDNDNLISDIKTLFLVDDDLELPSELREQIRRKENMVIFVGSGISKLLKIPLWDELAARSIKYLYTSRRMSFDESEKILKESISPKQKLSIFHNIMPKGSEGRFYADCFTPDKECLKRNPYDLLVKVPFAKFTLNLDLEFWNALLRLKKKSTSGEADSLNSDVKAFHIFEDFEEKTEINTDTLYQVHGAYNNLKNYSIITMTDYLSFYYGDKNTGLRDFLRKVFNEYSVIFLGVGMEEFELLQYLVKSNKKHHVLVGTYINDTNLLRFKKEYFKKALGIIAHGYYLDFNGYDRLYDVIDNWIKEIDREINGQFYDKTGEFNDVEL